MATVTAGYNWTSGETVTPAKLNSTAAPTVAVADGEVTLAKLVTAVQQALVPAGAVQAFAMNSAPSGWLAADGSDVSRVTYADLFTAIGTTYGAGDGSTTFALPDLRGYFVRGSGTNGDGTAAGTFGAKQADELKAHTHVVGSRVNATAFGTGIVAASNSPTVNGANNSTESTGGTETRPKNISMLYCIKF
jgi:microcystin-dependent protein